MKIFNCILALLLASYAHGQTVPLVVDHTKEIVFGQSGGFTGHFQYYAIAIRDAILACFDHINKAGGIDGKKLRLISLDDESIAQKTKHNIEMLYNKHGVTMFIGVMGTRGILSVLPLIKEKKIAMYFPWGSSDALSDPNLTNIINGSGLLNPQIDKIIDHIINTMKTASIAIFHADDDLSTAATEYAKKELAKVHAEPLAVATYNRFTMNIAKPADALMATDPRTIICIATSMPTVKLINNFFQNGFFGTTFLGIDSTFLVKDILRDQGSSIHYASAVPDPITSNIELAQNYRAQLAQYMKDPDYSILSFAYFTSATIMCHALKNSRKPLNNESIIAYLQSLKNTEIQGFPINFDPTNRYIFGNKVWLI
jgi:ABC-type branched-subunit amino acid transport system substrate-binding protein